MIPAMIARLPRGDARNPVQVHRDDEGERGRKMRTRRRRRRLERRFARRAVSGSCRRRRRRGFQSATHGHFLHRAGKRIRMHRLKIATCRRGHGRAPARQRRETGRVEEDARERNPPSGGASAKQIRSLKVGISGPSARYGARWQAAKLTREARIGDDEDARSRRTIAARAESHTC